MRGKAHPKDLGSCEMVHLSLYRALVKLILFSRLICVGLLILGGIRIAEWLWPKAISGMDAAAQTSTRGS